MAKRRARPGLVLLVSGAMLLAFDAPARAFEDYVGTRSLALGGALRGAAAGDSGPLLNPSGMTLARSYTIEAAYARSNRRDSNFFHGSVVDSTSGLNLAGGLYYTFQSNAPSDAPTGRGHEVGLAMALPLGDYVSLGGTAKYLRLSGDQAFEGHSGGTTFDVGVTVRPLMGLSLGAVGTNLYNLKNDEVPRTIGFGVGYSPVPELMLAVDGRTMLDASLRTGTKGTSVMGGGEFFLARRYAFRLGGGYDALDTNGYLSGGFSLVSEIGALDIAGRRDLFGVTGKAITVVTAGFRLFVPQP
ncbi:MAG TPA: hypothetical protein VMU50_06585 [Polyangia bacterium]|nr:hypothetical protein [Polyangia bacterium]